MFGLRRGWIAEVLRLREWCRPTFSMYAFSYKQMVKFTAEMDENDCFFTFSLIGKVSELHDCRCALPLRVQWRPHQRRRQRRGSHSRRGEGDVQTDAARVCAACRREVQQRNEGGRQHQVGGCMSVSAYSFFDKFWDALRLLEAFCFHLAKMKISFSLFLRLYFQNAIAIYLLLTFPGRVYERLLCFPNFWKSLKKLRVLSLFWCGSFCCLVFFRLNSRYTFVVANAWTLSFLRANLELGDSTVFKMAHSSLYRGIAVVLWIYLLLPASRIIVLISFQYKRICH